MVGRELSQQIYGNHARAIGPRGKTVLTVENLSMGKAVRNYSFSVYGGQITGLFGLIGSGRTETAKIISGVLRRKYFYGGTAVLEGRDVGIA